MTTITRNDEVEQYLREVREHLASLSGEAREEILDDLRNHLFEVAADSDVSLRMRLGDPAAFADDLVASAGLTVTDEAGADQPPSNSGLLARTLERGRRVANDPRLREVKTFLLQLVPGWWVLRAYLVVALLSGIQSGREALRVFPFLVFFDSAVVGFLVLASAIVA
ncbi:MAG: HAAS signaling domain-containing protein, partial [Pseudonocardiaceae bacterium]